MKRAGPGEKSTQALLRGASGASGLPRKCRRRFFYVPDETHFLEEHEYPLSDIDIPRSPSEVRRIGLRVMVVVEPFTNDGE